MNNQQVIETIRKTLCEILEKKYPSLLTQQEWRDAVSKAFNVFAENAITVMESLGLTFSDKDGFKRTLDRYKKMAPLYLAPPVSDEEAERRERQRLALCEYARELYNDDDTSNAMLQLHLKATELERMD